MSNFSKTTLARVGRLMNSGSPTDPAPLVKLAKSGGFGRKAIYNWSLPETDPQHRKMPRVAKRMIATLAYFSAAGLLTDKRMEEIVGLESLFENETEANATLRRVKRVLGKAGKAGGATRQAGAAAGGAASGGDDEHDMGDDDEHEATVPKAEPRVG